MKTMMHSIAILGCVVLVGNATMAYAEEMPAGSGHDGRILTINFIGQRSSAVALHYQAYEEEADGARNAMILIESLKRKLAEKGFERRHPADGWQDAVHGYSVFIVGDAAYSKEARALEKCEGGLTVIIVENDKLAAVNAAPAADDGLEYRQIENMADEIVTRLVLHSYI